MDYDEWLPLFGLPANDRRVAAALAAHGVSKPVALPSQEYATGVDFKAHGLSVGFTSEFTLSGGVADLPILASVVMMLILGKSAKGWTAYTGSLPHGLEKSHSKDDLVGLLGEPANLDEDYSSALWLIDGKELGVSFTDDWKHIKQLGLSLPGAL